MDKVRYWIDLAEYDLVTAESMFETKRWLYVGFMCHQVIEKSIKAYWNANLTTEPPYIHNLIRLNEGCGLDKLMTEEQLDFIDMMMPLNIEARYPSYKDELFKTLTAERCRYIVETTKMIFVWIKDKL